MKYSKKIILSVLTFAMFLCLSMISGVSAYADGVIVNIHYSNPEYANYKVSIWEDSEHGADFDFAQNGSEGIVKYTCNNPEVELVSFFVKSKDGAADVKTNRHVEIAEGVSEVDVYLTPGKEEFEVKNNDSASSQEQVSATTDTTTNANTANKVKGDDPNADYSFSTVVVIIIDIVFIAILAGISYTIFSKKK